MLCIFLGIRYLYLFGVPSGEAAAVLLVEGLLVVVVVLRRDPFVGMVAGSVFGKFVAGRLGGGGGGVGVAVVRLLRSFQVELAGLLVDGLGGVQVQFSMFAKSKEKRFHIAPDSCCLTGPISNYIIYLNCFGILRLPKLS